MGEEEEERRNGDIFWERNGTEREKKKGKGRDVMGRNFVRFWVSYEVMGSGKERRNEGKQGKKGRERRGVRKGRRGRKVKGR